MQTTEGNFAGLNFVTYSSLRVGIPLSWGVACSSGCTAPTAAESVGQGPVVSRFKAEAEPVGHGTMALCGSLAEQQLGSAASWVNQNWRVFSSALAADSQIWFEMQKKRSALQNHRSK